MVDTLLELCNSLLETYNLNMVVLLDLNFSPPTLLRQRTFILQISLPSFRWLVARLLSYLAEARYSCVRLCTNCLKLLFAFTVFVVFHSIQPQHKLGAFIFQYH